ncbi:MAG: glutathione S-transferase [Myxococcales bacterium]|nr:glutathione S-transferase [Myxococcales bacterium]
MGHDAKPYELFYWPFLPGRGEIIRLVLEEAGFEYRDVARLPESEGGGVAAVRAYYEGHAEGHPVFAPPILKHDGFVLSQLPAIVTLLGARSGLEPKGELGRVRALELCLMACDVFQEAHQTHHPLSVSLTYEEQQDAALVAAKSFREKRLPRLLDHFERVLGVEPGAMLMGDAITHADLALFQVMSGLEYAFPKTFATLAPKRPRILAHSEEVAARPRIRAYLNSPRRVPFSQHGIFRHYPELDLSDSDG